MIKMRCLILLVAALCLGSCSGGRLRKHVHRYNSSAHAPYSMKRSVAPPSPKYYGCFDGSRLDFPTTKLIQNNHNGACQQFCRNEGFMFSATHKDVCGCFTHHPTKEVSGPPHGAATVRVNNVGKKCNVVCPEKQGSEVCDEPSCCGGDLTYTVYQVGGLNKKRCSPALMKELQRKGVDLQKSGLPTDCGLGAAAHRDSAAEHGLTLDAKSVQSDEECKEDYTKKPHPWACCSPDCDWLVEYLCIDGTVVKCIDK